MRSRGMTLTSYRPFGDGYHEMTMNTRSQSTRHIRGDTAADASGDTKTRDALTLAVGHGGSGMLSG